MKIGKNQKQQQRDDAGDYSRSYDDAVLQETGTLRKIATKPGKGFFLWFHMVAPKTIKFGVPLASQPEPVLPIRMSDLCWPSKCALA